MNQQWLLFAGWEININKIDIQPVFQTQIDGEFNGWEGETVFKLMNGQVWKQSSYAYHYSYKFMPKVTIYKSSYGYKMKVDGDSETVDVEQIN